MRESSQSPLEDSLLLKKLLNTLKEFPVPANEKSLRVIAITNHFSLVYERFVLKWLLHYVKDKLDPDQFGGTLFDRGTECNTIQSRFGQAIGNNSDSN